jgi:hypothetical protein
VPAFHEALRLGLALNPGFASRATLHEKVVYDQPGSYVLRVPKQAGRRRKKLGMTSMAGSVGHLKTNWLSASYNHTASSVRWIPYLDPIPGSHAWIPRMDPTHGSHDWIPRLDPTPGSHA